MKSKTVFFSTLIVFILASIAFAAVGIELPVTGQTNCYSGWYDNGQIIPCADTGQDGEMRAGVAWPSPRFTNLDNSLPLNGDCVLDRLTGLIWPRDGYHGFTTWSEAVDYANNFTLCGYSDWHLPNINQLESLLNANEPNSSTWLNAQGFYNVQAYSYWSSSTYTYLSGAAAWCVYMVGGNTYYNPKYESYYVWPVRSSQQSIPDPAYPANLWKTGQVSSYHTGDDGDLQRGVAWPDPRFSDHGDGTVTDNLTGLMWLQDADCIFTEYPDYDPDGDGSLYWLEALGFIHGMNDGTYANCGADYYDWRLPNRKEFLSLVDRSQYGPALPDDNPFIYVQMQWYFTSTTNANYHRIPWHMVMRDGYINTFGYLDRNFWPVRGGMVGEEFIYYCDKDNDGYIDSIMEDTCTGIGCEPPDCQTTAGSDCDDYDPIEFPNQTWYADLDDDNYTSGVTMQQCGRPLNHKAETELINTTVDCDDNDPAEHPHAQWFIDVDGDGYGDINFTTEICTQPIGYVENNLDCDDRLDGADGLPGTIDDGANLSPSEVEVCDNLDNNCDGSVDESLIRQSTCGVGVCASIGIETCTAGIWGGNTCTPGTKSETTDVTCDGFDGDCDGTVDEDYVPTSTSCGDGQCSGNTGQLECQSGTEVDTCDPLAGATAEICDNLDNNCDSSIDENLTQTITCGVGVCASTVLETCTAGVWGGDTCTPGTKSETTDVICDGLDGDCDGEVDEDYVPTSTSCGVGQCSGNTGQVECQSGIEVDTCDPLAGATTEVCDGADNNCDGQIDENTCTSPEITSPVPGSTLSDTTVTFYWTNHATAVSQWWLYVGSSPGGSNIANSGSLGSSNTSYTVNGLPTDGSQVYVRLWYNVGTWQYVDSQFTAYTGSGGDGTPEITSPVPDSTLSGSTETFMWTANGTAVSQWWLYVGSSPGTSNIANSGSLGGSNTSYTVNGLPTDGSQVYVRLWYNVGTWQYVDSQFTAYTGSGGGGTPEITSPVPGSTLSGSTETFMWTANGTAVSQWWLYVGSSTGSSNIANSGSLGTSTSSYTVNNLPTNGSQVYVRLWYNTGSWQYVDFQYTAFTGSGGGSEPEMTSPLPGSTLSGSTETFMWTANGTAVSQWWLWVGSSMGSSNISTSGSLGGSNTSYTVNGLPTDGSQVYVRLWYNVGTWQYMDFQYTAW